MTNFGRCFHNLPATKSRLLAGTLGRDFGVTLDGAPADMASFRLRRGPGWDVTHVSEQVCSQLEDIL